MPGSSSNTGNTSQPTYERVPLTESPPTSGTSSSASALPSSSSATAGRSCLQIIASPFVDLYRFFSELSQEFGWRFVCIVVLVYGFNQGFGEGYLSQGRLYYLKDERHLQPTETTTVLAAAHIPWNMKTIYGSWSDALPFFGYHRTPYIVFAGLLGTLAWLAIAVDFSTSLFGVTMMLVRSTNMMLWWSCSCVRVNIVSCLWRLK